LNIVFLQFAPSALFDKAKMARLLKSLSARRLLCGGCLILMAVMQLAGQAHAQQASGDAGVETSSMEDRWAKTVSQVADSVVALKLSQLRDFDGC